jgi:BMFP domain-containing protein YqiC
MDSYEIANEEFQAIKLMIDELRVKVSNLENRLKQMGAAYTPGRPKAIN